MVPGARPPRLAVPDGRSGADGVLRGCLPTWHWHGDPRVLGGDVPAPGSSELGLREGDAGGGVLSASQHGREPAGERVCLSVISEQNILETPWK